jgi:ABC-type spermidine/putrescine transport system permease subunit I
MIATFFFALSAVFIWLLFKGYSILEIKARGWGSQVRSYHRSSEPIMYWVTFWIYVVIAVLCAAIGILMAIKSIANHAA